MKITHSLIQQFLEDRCTHAEAEAVAPYLKEHPELMDIYLGSAWDAASKESEMPEGYAEEMRKMIFLQIEKKSKLIRFRWLSVAASLLIVGTAVWFFSRETKPPVHTLAGTEDQPAVHVRWRSEANSTSKTLRIKLDDGSIVKLAPGARIKYQEPFAELEQRDIYMEGEAEFDVNGTKTKPFAVHTQLFSTIALGTSFRVSETANACTVRLYHGKVMIKCLVDSLKGWNRDIILKPGSEMKYNIGEAAVTVNAFNTVQRPQSQPLNNGSSTSVDGGMVFDNTPLPDVMKILTTRYHSPIFYNEAQLKGKFFSGEVLHGDSLSVLLDLIANMNGMQVTRKDNGYLIELSR